MQPHRTPPKADSIGLYDDGNEEYTNVYGLSALSQLTTRRHFDENDTDDKLVGVNGSAAEADAARRRKLQFADFRDDPDCFRVSEYEVDKGAWSDRFITVKTAG